MFKMIYEVINGQNADPAYTTDIYPFVGFVTMGVTVMFSIVFYLMLGRWRPVWHKLVHWLITSVLLGILSAFLSISQAKSITGESADSYMYVFALTNALLAMICFVLLSLFLKRASIFAKRTPF